MKFNKSVVTISLIVLTIVDTNLISQAIYLLVTLLTMQPLTLELNILAFLIITLSITLSIYLTKKIYKKIKEFN